MRLSKSESDIANLLTSEKSKWFTRFAISSTPNLSQEMHQTTSHISIVEIEMMNTSSISINSFALTSVTNITNTTDAYSSDGEDKSPQ
jgi:hypothetical protein